MPATITPQDIKEIRSRYGLSQKSFALLLGIGPSTIVRYEQGDTPTKANANLIRAARNPDFMRECLEADGDQIPNYQRIRAESVIYDYISLDPEEDARMHEGLPKPSKPTLSMDEMYHYTLQQEILNEQAANIMGDIMNFMLVEGIEDGSKESEPFDLLLSQLVQVKRQIVSPDSDNDVFLERIRGYLQYRAPLVDGLCQRAEVA